MFEIIEDNKHLILLIFVAILFFSSIFANKYSTKFNKKKLIKDSLNLLRKEAPNMNRRIMMQIVNKKYEYIKCENWSWIKIP